MNLYPILSPWASPELLPLPLRPFSGITPPIRVLPSDGETRTSFNHTFRENPSTSGVTVLVFTIKVYKLHGLSKTVNYGFLGDNQAVNLTSPSISTIDHYTGIAWKLCSYYVGIAKESHFTCLYKLGNYPVAFANYTDSAGDILYVTEIAFPNSYSAHSYMLSISPSTISFTGKAYVATYISGFTEVVYLPSWGVKGAESLARWIAPLYLNTSLPKFH